jgi:hypothetical protein
MALTTLESLVLGGIRVKAGVKTMLVREGSKRGHDQTSASMSHPSWPMDHDQADSRCDLFDEIAAIRAGRSVSPASVPVRCSVASDLSLTHQRTIRARWSLAEGGPCSTAVRRYGDLATTRTSAANELPAYCVRGSVLAAFSRLADGIKQMPKQASGKNRLAWPMPMSAMPSASTRGA